MPWRISQQQRRDGTRVVLALRHSERGYVGEPQRLYSEGEGFEGPGLSAIASASHQARSAPVAAARAGAAGAVAAGRRLLAKVFLPIDYPKSVSKNYLPFVRATMLQMFFGHVSRILATQAMLFAVGVGAKTALPLAMVTSWILKDGLGQIGAIIFGTVVNTRFDSDPKRFRFHAAVLGKLADYLCVFTLGNPQYFLLLSSFGSAAGRVSQSASQSCRAKIYETFALSSNLGDVLRCSTTQTIATQLLATGVAICLGPVVADDIYRLLLGNGVFSTVALYCSYVSCTMVCMSTLNEQRAELVFKSVVAQVAASEEELIVPSVEEVQKSEVFVSRYRSVFPGPPLAINPPMAAEQLILTSAPDVRHTRLMLGLLPAHSAKEPSVVALWLHELASPEDAIRGFFQACVLRSLLTSNAAQLSPALASEVAAARAEVLAQAAWPRVHAALLAKGWRTDVAFLDVKEGRVRLE